MHSTQLSAPYSVPTHSHSRQGVAGLDHVLAYRRHYAGQIANSAKGPGIGWGTWIRTKTNRVRVCCATVTPFPNGIAEQIQWLIDLSGCGRKRVWRKSRLRRGSVLPARPWAGKRCGARARLTRRGSATPTPYRYGGLDRAEVRHVRRRVRQLHEGADPGRGAFRSWMIYARDIIARGLLRIISLRSL